MTAMRAGICLVALGAAHAAKPYSHGWDTVADVMGMHGKFKSADVQPNDEVRRVLKIWRSYVLLVVQ